MSQVTSHLDILEKYHTTHVGSEVEELGALGGSSGSLFWKIYGNHSAFCLRRWAKEYPTLERLQFMHAILWHLHQEGFTRVPLPVETREHLGYVADQGYFWQLEPWIEGEADFAARPSRAKLLSAMLTLADMHEALRTFPVEYNHGPSVTAAVRRQQIFAWDEVKIEAIFDRVCLLDCLRTTGIHPTKIGYLDHLADTDLPPCPDISWEEELSETPRTPIHHLNAAAKKILRTIKHYRPAILRQLSECLEHDVPMQPCVREIHAGHVFFKENRVSGILDFGAVQLDNVSVDIARLLGSLAGNDVEMWTDGLNAYQTVRRLSRRELKLVRLLDHCHTAAAALRWLETIYITNHITECSPRVVQQMKTLFQRLERF